MSMWYLRMMVLVALLAALPAIIMRFVAKICDYLYMCFAPVGKWCNATCCVPLHTCCCRPGGVIFTCKECCISCQDACCCCCKSKVDQGDYGTVFIA